MTELVAVGTAEVPTRVDHQAISIHAHCTGVIV